MKILRILSALILFFTSCQNNETTDEVKSDDINQTRRMEGEELAKRGEYLVTIGGCNDCHSPKNFNPQGFTFDSSKLLSGHPAGAQLPPINTSSLQPGNWISASPDLTAWIGPWGMSYTANLTPDTATGIGNWTEENFRNALRKGTHMGMDNGRPIMPPMPWEIIGQMTDEDLSAVFVYLKSIPPVKNMVPQPIPPDQVRSMAQSGTQSRTGSASPTSQPQ